MAWNYRVVRVPTNGSESGFIYSIVEGHYDENEDGTINENIMAVTNPIAVESESYEGLKEVLTNMLNDLERFKDEVIDQVIETGDGDSGIIVEDPLSE